MFLFGRSKNPVPAAPAGKPAADQPLKEAMREARIEAAERTSVVVDLRDAAAARLELLNEALDPVFAGVPGEVDLFDRGISRGDVPRLWVDAIAHVEMGADKRQYRFVQDTRYGRAVLAESYDIAEIAQAVTRYVARRMVERERALADDASGRGTTLAMIDYGQRRQRWRVIGAFILGVLAGVAALVALALLTRP
jgi:hypothetical protein